jgi:hypothetical protein
MQEQQGAQESKPVLKDQDTQTDPELTSPPPSPEQQKAQESKPVLKNQDTQTDPELAPSSTPALASAGVPPPPPPPPPELLRVIPKNPPVINSANLNQAQQNLKPKPPKAETASAPGNPLLTELEKKLAARATRETTGTQVLTDANAERTLATAGAATDQPPKAKQELEPTTTETQAPSQHERKKSAFEIARIRKPVQTVNARGSNNRLFSTIRARLEQGTA